MISLFFLIFHIILSIKYLNIIYKFFVFTSEFDFFVAIYSINNPISFVFTGEIGFGEGTFFNRVDILK
jgi:hypothetical protein